MTRIGLSWERICTIIYVAFPRWYTRSWQCHQVQFIFLERVDRWAPKPKQSFAPIQCLIESMNWNSTPGLLRINMLKRHLALRVYWPLHTAVFIYPPSESPQSSFRKDCWCDLTWSFSLESNITVEPGEIHLWTETGKISSCLSTFIPWYSLINCWGYIKANSLQQDEMGFMLLTKTPLLLVE